MAKKDSNPLTMADLEHTLSQQAVADILRVKLCTLAQWRHLDRGPRFCKIGGRVAYRRSDIDDWLRGRIVTPTR